ncbi:beta galactosidase jelly roll domain-containing protein [Sphingobacterium sp. N143]|uniref:sialate O-acetylesterase n=1 Tax=Sphingobacterium sp. N143 TaxID=2746727 RepID=UPI002576B391|nr:sialate O-acetylesterase [Sphingobacterium sp. N143]MDM1296328.1 beta galactosidase jelly roll domain-containing protein [Sphingobacterium sp. N143]
MKKRKACVFVLTLSLLLYAGLSSAAIRLPALIGDRMVLQRDTELKIWGWADRGEKITVRFRGKSYFTEADSAGNWAIRLPAQKAGGPELLQVNEIAVRDILIGDVWLCSGQSNMETPIERLVERFPEINNSNNHMIRYFKVPTQHARDGQKEIADGGRWYSAVASEVMSWTALAYFYAQQSYAHTGVPVGMLVSSLGGSTIESWISQDQLKEFPRLLLDRPALDSMRLAQQDRGIRDWIKPNWDDSSWPTFTVPGLWRDQGIDRRGVLYFRRSFQLPAALEGRYATLYLGTLVDSDSVFVNGQFVGATGYMYPPRKYTVPAGILHVGHNNVTVRLRSQTGNGGFVEDKSYRLVVNDHEIKLTGEWKYQVGMDLDLVNSYLPRLKNLKESGSQLYNAMIYPIKDVAVKGVIWYQGESNTDEPQKYEKYLRLLIKDWRLTLQRPELPFLLVQLPNYMRKQEHPSESGWAGVREAQFKVTREVPYTALTVNYDIGEWNDIHPLNKKDLASRLFLAARKLVYGEKLVSAGPTYQHMEIRDNKIRLFFTDVGSGLASRDGPVLKHFAIAGADRHFVWAEAVIKGNTVVVSHKDVPHPVAVRYAWGDNPADANLINKEQLLASPFRTDSW